MSRMILGVNKMLNNSISTVKQITIEEVMAERIAD